MPEQDSASALQLSLQAIIEEMKQIQAQIKSSSQPASMHELDALSELGIQYADVIKLLRSSR